MRDTFTAIPDIVYAQVLDGQRTALVFRLDNTMFGGVAFMREMTVHIETEIKEYFGYDGHMDVRAGERKVTSELHIQFEAFRVVTDAAAFIKNREWEDRKQLTEVKKLGHD